MNRLPSTLRKDRTTIKFLNDRENLRKIIQDREFNLERRKQLKKILEEQSKELYSAQQKKVKKLKSGRGKNLRGELARNRNLQRRFEVGERRYKETEEPRIVGDAPQVIPGMAVSTGMTPEDRQIALQKLQLEREQLAVKRGETMGNLQLRQLEIENDRAIRAEENAIRRLELEAKKDNIPIPEIAGGERPFNIGDHQFIGNLLTGLAQDRQRERDATNNLIHKFLQHNERVQGNVSPDLLSKLFNQAQQTGLRVEGQEGTQAPNPSPADYNQTELSLEDVGSNIREILRPPPVILAGDKQREGTQTIGALTELEQELNKPDERLNKSINDLQADLQRGADNVSRFLETAEPDLPEIEPSEVSSITWSEWDRRVNKAEGEYDKTSEGINRALEAQRFNQENPFALIEVDNPLNEIDLTRSQISRFDREAQEQTERDLELIQNQGINLGELAELQQEERQLDLEQIEIGEEEQAIEEGAGVGVLQQAIVGGGQVEELEEPGIVIEPTEEGELLEEVAISTQNPVEQQEAQDFDYGEFAVHHQEQASKRGRRTEADRARGPKYSISNTSDREHKKLAPGEKVDITSYGADTKGETIGYFSQAGGASYGPNRRETKLQLGALNKSMDKGLLKLHKNY